MRKWSFRHNGREYELYEVDLQLPNAYTAGKKIGYTSKLREILTDEEFKAIILHEIGHIENKFLDCLLRISVALWILTAPFIVFIDIRLSNWNLLR